jgi:hypothetical protein
LRLEPGDDAGEDRATADLTQWLVAAAHPAREAARKHHAWRAGNFRHLGRLSQTRSTWDLRDLDDAGSRRLPLDHGSRDCMNLQADGI